MELEFFPAQSPNLNLIEQAWKWVKQECLNAWFYADFPPLKAANHNCLPHGHREHHEESVALLSWNQQFSV